MTQTQMYAALTNKDLNIELERAFYYHYATKFY